LPRLFGNGRFGLYASDPDLPRLFGNGRFGLYASDPDLPRLFGKGRFGLYATDPDLPRLFGKGRFGLTFVADMPRLFGNGKLGLLLDTFALAMQGTTRTADKAATDSSFIKRASPRVFGTRGVSPTYYEP